MPKFLNIIFIIHLLAVGLVITEVLPRSVVPFWTIVLMVYVLRAPLEDSAIFFVRSIPFFIAIPITTSFDSLNMWRILSGLIFLKWLVKSGIYLKIMTQFKNSFLLFKYDRIVMQIWELLKKHGAAAIILGVILFSALSVIQAQSQILAIKRIIYFVNLSLISIVVYDLALENQDFGQRLIKNIAIPTIIVAVIGMVQLTTTYFMDIFQFVDFWGGMVERNLFGNAWAETAARANTWFAYFGNQLSLRMFSIFPDSHSFPIFLLLGLPAVMAIALRKVAEKGGTLKVMFRTRASMLIVFVAVIFLAAILSGTRGIWVASIPTLLITVFLIIRLKKSALPNLLSRQILTYISSYLAIFFLLFGVAYYIIASDQFMVEKDSTGLLTRRARSVIDISETSNARRIEIWNDSFRSIIKHPLLGVGIGNFPVVVREDLARAKAGSSAHNLYLHIAAEIGIPTLIIALLFLWLLLKKTYGNFLETRNQKLETIYFAALLICLPWVLIYSLTDVAIFDERAFLLFVTTVALIFSSHAKS